MSNEVLIALISAGGGGALLALVNKFLGRNKERFDFGTQYRNELRADLEKAEAEALHWKGEANTWRDKFYDLRDGTGTPKK